MRFGLPFDPKPCPTDRGPRPPLLMILRFLPSVFASLLLAGSCLGQISYTGGTYTQDFDSLPNSGTYTLSGAGPIALDAAPISAAGMAGWSLALVPGSSGANALFRIDTGASNSGSAYSYGGSASTNRALGSLASGTTISRFGAVFTNGTGNTVTSVTVSYTGQQWRNGGSNVANTLRFSYAVGAANISDTAATFTEVTSLNFVSPVTSTTVAPLDGTLPANQRALTAQIGGILWGPGQTLVIRWNDANDAGSDDGLAVDDFSFTTATGGGPLVVSSTTPANGAVNQAPNGNLSVTFNHPVTVNGNWYQISGSASGAHPSTVTGGPATFNLKPTTELAFGETVSVTFFAANIVDQNTGLNLPADYTFSYGTVAAPTTTTFIHDIQGNGASSPMVGATVRIQGVVVGSFQSTTNGLKGFFVQEEDADADNDPNTSEGIFVFDNGNAPAVAVGQLVTVVGTVAEFNGLTELSPVLSTQVNGFAPLPTAVQLTLPFASATDLEKYEGMRVVLPQTLTVTNNFALGQYGEFVLSLSRLAQPTNVTTPGGAANALQAQNNLSTITVDDGSSAQYVDPTPFEFGPSSTFRTGTTVTGLVGVVTYFASTYLIEPTSPPVFVDANPRTPPPTVGGKLRIVGANVLNYFNGDGLGGGFPTARGATNLTEFNRQRAKVIGSLSALKADIYGLTEVENDGYGPTSALQDIVNGLNALAPSGTSYSAIAPSFALGTDVIRVALIYRNETVTPVGLPATTTDVSFSRARPPLAQTFQELEGGEKLTVCINHFRAKGSADSSSPLNLDQGDGQATNNYLRVQEAQALTSWLATDPTASGDPDFLIIGDLNSYAMEDPIMLIKSVGYTDLTRTYEGASGYSYAFAGQFGHLDYALATASLASQVTGTQAWHNNSDEPIFLDYNLENKTPAQAALNVGTPYRASDHDPILIGVTLSPAQAPLVTQDPASQTVNTGDTVTFTVGVTGTPALSYQWFKDLQLLGGATNSTLVLPSVGLGAAGSYTVAVTNFKGTATSGAANLVVHLTYNTWSSGIAWAPGADTTPTGDPDRDGISNLLEFVQNLDPLSNSNAQAPTFTTDGTNATFTFRLRKNLGAVSVVVETSTDLQAWSSAGTGTYVSTVDASTDLYRVTVPAPVNGQILARLRATTP